MTDPGRGGDPLPPELAAVHVTDGAADLDAIASDPAGEGAIDRDDEAAIHAALEAMDADDRFGGPAPVAPSSAAEETIDSGARRPRTDEASMGFGGESRSIEELERDVIGEAQQRADGVTREDERHGAGFLDRPEER